MNPLPLWIAPVPGDFQPHLTPFLLPGDVVRPCIVVCPGGGYGGRARHEADPIAQKFNALGFHAFVLEYRVHPQAHFPEPQQDALRAIKLVRARAAEFRIRPDAIAILGFSAGGHLAVSASFLYDRIEANAGDATQAGPALAETPTGVAQKAENEPVQTEAQAGDAVRGEGAPATSGRASQER